MKLQYEQKLRQLWLLTYGVKPLKDSDYWYLFVESSDCVASMLGLIYSNTPQRVGPYIMPQNLRDTKVCDVWFYNGALQAPREISFSWEEFGVLKPWKGYFSLCGLHCGGGLLSRDLIISYALFKSMKTIWRSLQASIFFY